MKEGFKALGKVEKPKFRWKNLPNYIWIEGSMIAGTVSYIVWRVGRIFKG